MTDLRQHSKNTLKKHTQKNTLKKTHSKKHTQKNTLKKTHSKNTHTLTHKQHTKPTHKTNTQNQHTKTTHKNNTQKQHTKTTHKNNTHTHTHTHTHTNTNTNCLEQSIFPYPRKICLSQSLLKTAGREGRPLYSHVECHQRSRGMVRATRMNQASTQNPVSVPISPFFSTSISLPFLHLVFCWFSSWFSVPLHRHPLLALHRPFSFCEIWAFLPLFFWVGFLSVFFECCRRSVMFTTIRSFGPCYQASENCLRNLSTATITKP